MRKTIKKTVYEILLKDEYARENDNYLIMKVAQKLDPVLANGLFIDIQFSNLSFESITRARRQFFKEYPELKPKKMTEIREREEQEYYLEYSHIPRLDKEEIWKKI